MILIDRAFFKLEKAQTALILIEESTINHDFNLKGAQLTRILLGPML
jgi:hypothetical protein